MLRAGTFAVALLTGIAVPLTACAEQGPDGGELVLVSGPASYLGVNIRDIDEHGAQLLGLKSTAGVEVTAVDHDAPAGKAGLHLRDVILTVDGNAVTSAGQFRETMRGFPPGKLVDFGVMRNGKPLKFAIRLADRMKLQQQAWEQHFNVPMPMLGSTFGNAVAMQRLQQPPSEGDPSDDGGEDLPAQPYRIGALLEGIGPQLAAYFGVKDGTGLLVQSVDPGGPAAAAGLQAGDVVLKLNEERILSPIDWLRAMQSAQGKPLQLTIVRNKRIEVLTISAVRTQARFDGSQAGNRARLHWVRSGSREVEDTALS